jgi:hypothetical protein
MHTVWKNWFDNITIRKLSICDTYVACLKGLGRLQNAQSAESKPATYVLEIMQEIRNSKNSQSIPSAMDQPYYF